MKNKPLYLLTSYVRNVLDLDNNVRVSMEEYEDKRKIIIEFPNIETCANKISLWASWKNAYKHRRR